MRLGSTTLSVTQPGRRRRAGAGVVSGGGGGGNAQGGGGGGGGTTYFADIDDYSFTRFDKINVPAQQLCQATRFKPDGTVVYTLDWVPDQYDNTIRQQSLSTAWDISTHGSTTATLSTAGTGFMQSTDFFFKPDGTQLWIVEYDGDLRMFNLSTAWDISTATYSNDVIDLTSGSSTATTIFWKPDGTSLYYCDTSTDRIYRLNFSTAWDITSSYTTQQSIELDLSTTANEGFARGLYIPSDGSKVYITGYLTDDVFMYNLSTAWDITSFSGVYDSILNTTPQESTPLGLTFSPDGLYMYLVGNGSDGVNQYTRQSSPSQIVTTNLALHVDAGDTNSYSGTGTTWTDLTSNSNDLTLINGPVYSSINNGIFDFDGVDDYATTSGSTVSINASQDFSFDAWIWIDDSGVNSIFNIGDYSLSSGIVLYTASTTRNLSVYTNNGLAFSSGPVTLNTWTHVAISRSGSTVTVYLDGSSVGTYTNSAALSGQFDLAISKYGGSYSNAINGKISNARLYIGTALTSAEVTQNYDATKDRFGVVTTNLIAHVDAGDTNSYSGTGTTWSDLTSNSNDFTLINGPVYSSSTNGGVFTFDATDDRAETSNTVSLSGDYSFDAWINTGGGSNTVFSIGNFDLTSGLRIVTGSTGTAYYFQITTGNSLVYNGSLIASGPWAHVALVRSGSTNTLYLNATSIATFTNSATLSGNLYLGASKKSTVSYYELHLGGNISNARLYEGTALSATEVTQNYDALRGRF